MFMTDLVTYTIFIQYFNIVLVYEYALVSCTWYLVTNKMVDDIVSQFGAKPRFGRAKDFNVDMKMLLYSDVVLILNLNL